MSPIPIGFIGGSLQSAVGNTHRIASQMDNRFKLVAGCFSRSHGINAETGRAWGVEENRLYAEWQELIDSEPETVLVLLTPPAHHAEVLEYAASRGRHLVCEKPLTNSAEATSRVVEVLDDRLDRFFAVYNYTGYPMIREMRQVIQDGSLGELLHCEIEMPQEGFIRLNPDGSSIQPQEWRRSDGFIPTVSLDLGVHVVNLLRFVTQQHPTRVVASYQSRGNVPGVVDHVTALAECADGFTADLRFGKTSLGHSNGLSISVFGSHGSVGWKQVNHEFLTMNDSFGTTSVIHRGSASARIAQQLRYNRFKAGHPGGFLEAFSNLYFDIADAIETRPNKDPYTFSAKDALRDMSVLHALSDSVTTQEWTVVK